MKIFKWSSNIFWKILRNLMSFLGFNYAMGHLTIISGGPNTITILLDFTPKRVWISPHRPHGIPTCGGSSDCFDVSIVPDGFVMHINLQSESRQFDWIAEGF